MIIFTVLGFIAYAVVVFITGAAWGHFITVEPKNSTVLSAKWIVIGAGEILLGAIVILIHMLDL